MASAVEDFRAVALHDPKGPRLPETYYTRGSFFFQDDEAHKYVAAYLAEPYYSVGGGGSAPDLKDNVHLRALRVGQMQGQI